MTASDFYKFLKCPNWLYWDIFGDQNEKGEVSEMMKNLREQGVAHEKKVVDDLFGECEEVEVEMDLATSFKNTLEAMKRGECIYQGTLMHEDWVGRPDILIPTESPSKLGKWTYEAVDIKSTNSVHDVHKYQLMFYGLLLEKIQGKRPKLGKIINVHKITLEFLLDDIYSDFFGVLDRILKIRAGEKPDPYLTSGCKESPWYSACKKEAKDSDDISQIYKIYKKEYRKLKDAGYHTIKDFSGADFEVLDQAVAGISRKRLERLQLQAIALRDNKVIRIDEPDVPDTDIELHFDIEGDPFLGVEYLFGILVKKGGKAEYKIFLAEDPKDEGKAWLAFCDFIEEYAGTPIYHYGWYELDVIKRLGNKYGISVAAAEALDHSNMIDLNRILQKSVIFPLYFLSLKDVCRYLGFNWRAEDASGANSVLWFQNWLESGDRKVLQKIIDYNEDDVRATLFLKDWLVKGE